MKKLLFMLCLCGLALVPDDLHAGPTPLCTVQLWLNAAQAGNVPGVKAQMRNGGKLGNGDAEGIAAMQIMFEGAMITTVENVDSNRAIVYISIKEPLSGERQTVPVSVSKIGSNWLIDDKI